MEIYGQIDHTTAYSHTLSCGNPAGHPLVSWISAYHAICNWQALALPHNHPCSTLSSTCLYRYTTGDIPALPERPIPG